MQLETPTIPPAPLAREGEEETSEIGIGVVSYPDGFTYSTYLIIDRALRADLSRREINVIKCLGFCNKAILTCLVTVAKINAGEAITTLKATLEELGLADIYAIAHHPMEGVWFTVHGGGTGGRSFANLFLRPEDMTEGLKIAQAWTAERVWFLKALQAQCPQPEASEGAEPNPT